MNLQILLKTCSDHQIHRIKAKSSQLNSQFITFLSFLALCKGSIGKALISQLKSQMKLYFHEFIKIHSNLKQFHFQFTNLHDFT